MSFQELSKKIEELGKLNEQFRQLTDRRLNEIECRGSVDPLTTQQINRMNNQLDLCQGEIDRLKATAHRPSVGSVKGFNQEDGRYQKAFCDYLRHGSTSGLEVVQHKSLSQQPGDRDGGYLLTSRMHEIIHKASDDECVMRKLATVVTISSDALELIEDTTKESAGWSEEMSVVLDRQEHSCLASKKIIPVHELYAQPKATQKMLDDTRIDVENWLSERLSYVFNSKEGESFINGDGVNKPRGILSYPEFGADKIARIESTEPGRITADSLINLFFSLKSKYTKNAKFLLSREALQQIRLLRDRNGRYLWQAGLRESNPANILGAEVVVSADMPTAISKSTPIAFGDFRQGYHIVDRQGIRILRDPYTLKPFVKFYSTKRIGGDVVDFDAIKLLQL